MLHEILPFVVSGLTTGAVYGMLGVGLVLTFKTSGLFNFAHGAIAALSAISFYALHVNLHAPWAVAAVVSVLVVGPALGLIMEPFAARLGRLGTTQRVVATIGIMLVVIGSAQVAFGANPVRVESFLPGGSRTFTAGGVVVLWNQVIIATTTALVVAALVCVFRYSRLGLAMRAVVDDPELYGMQGRNPVATRRTAWVIGCVFAALSGVLLVPLLGLDVSLLTFLVVQSFGAAAIGSFSSIPLTFAGGIVVGVASDVVQKYSVDTAWLNGLPPSLPFIILFVVLLVLRRGAVPGQTSATGVRERWRAPGNVQALVGLVVLAGLVLVPPVAGDLLPFYVTALATVIITLSLGLLVRLSGQVSLCHATFAAIGAVAFSQFDAEHGLPWLLAVLLAGLVVVPVGAFLALPAIRLPGVFLALATLGFGISVQYMFYGQSWMFSQTSTIGRVMPAPSFASSPRAVYYLALALTVAAAVASWMVGRSRLGRYLRGMAGSETAMRAAGLNTNVTRLVIFCISAFMAGIGGVVYGMGVGYAGAGDPFFAPTQSLLLLAMQGLGLAFGAPWYALIVSTGAVIPGYLHGPTTVPWLLVVFGVFAVMSTVLPPPETPGWLRDFAQRLSAVLPSADWAAKRKDPLDPGTYRMAPPRPGLVVRDLVVRFSGNVAVDRISLQAPVGEITGLIGPNGAGKTTTFNACTGLNRRFSGAIEFHGTDVTRKTMSARARSGLGRTFQRFELCDELTVFENVRLGCEAGQGGGRAFSQILASRQQAREGTQAARAALEQCGIAGLATTIVGTLSTGERRLVELARCLAGPFDLLLLDEPSSGLERSQSEAFGQLLRTIVETRGVGILLVEHDVELVLSLCSYIYVLDFGQMLYSGTPVEVAGSEVVQAAYLGSKSLLTTDQAR